MSVTTESPAGATTIRPFHVAVANEALDDLRRRVAATNWPEQETVVDKGGHFAAWEQPELFSQEIRAAFRSLRSEGGPHEHHRDRS